MTKRRTSDRDMLSPRGERLLLLLILAGGLFFRAWNLRSPLLWEDEAESSINALTILQHGYPTDQYLGLPLYENTLLRPWPESREYAFKDLSYSDRGIAVYHGWLPLYSIAASFALWGVEPDDPQDQARVKHDLAEGARRTMVARLPSLVFSVVTMLMLFACGRVFFGKDAAWTALAAGAFLDSLVWMGRQARYYSATLALSSVCGFLAWGMLRRGRWRDFICGGFAFVLLFHTQLLSFVTLSVLWSLLLPFLLRHRQGLVKSAVFGLLVGLGVAPWVLWTGFLEQSTFIPRAWPFLSLPDDLILYLVDHKAFVALYGAGLLWGVGLRVWRQQLPESLRIDFLLYQRAVVFLCAWIFLAALVFLLFVPAASFFFTRLSLQLLPPCVLLAALLMASVTRLCGFSQQSMVAPVLLLLFLFGANRVGHVGGTVQSGTVVNDFRPLVAYLQQTKFRPGTKFYTTPNDHLPLTFYTGLPFQSIASVRKEFLDAYDRDIVFLELVCCVIEETDPLSWRGLQQAGLTSGAPLTETDAKQWAALLSTRIAREEVATSVAQVHPPLETLTPFFAQAVHDQQQLIESRRVMMAEAYQSFPLYRGFSISTPADWWQTFFYRFVDPEAHRGLHANYRERLRRAEAFTFPGLPWVLYYSGQASGLDHPSVDFEKLGYTFATHAALP